MFFCKILLNSRSRPRWNKALLMMVQNTLRIFSKYVKSYSYYWRLWCGEQALAIFVLFIEGFMESLIRSRLFFFSHDGSSTTRFLFSWWIPYVNYVEDRKQMLPDSIETWMVSFVFSDKLLVKVFLPPS